MVVDELEQEAIIYLKENCYSIDTEANHIEADNTLCDVLRILGYTDLVSEYDKINKWYA